MPEAAEAAPVQPILQAAQQQQQQNVPTGSEAAPLAWQPDLDTLLEMVGQVITATVADPNQAVGPVMHSLMAAHGVQYIPAGSAVAGQQALPEGIFIK